MASHGPTLPGAEICSSFSPCQGGKDNVTSNSEAGPGFNGLVVGLNGISISIGDFMGRHFHRD